MLGGQARINEMDNGRCRKGFDQFIMVVWSNFNIKLGWIHTIPQFMKRFQYVMITCIIL